MNAPAPAAAPHRIELAVRFRETDAYGIVWHGHYLDWLECARNQYADHFGCGPQALRALGFQAPMLECHLEFRSPARFGDTVSIAARLEHDPRRVVAFSYEIASANRGDSLARARSVQVLQGPDGKLALAWPAAVTTALTAIYAYQAELAPPPRSR